VRVRRLALSILLLAACRDSATTPPPPTATPAVPPRVDVADPLALLPADSDVVIRLDLAAARKSPLWPKYEPTVRDFIVPGFADCGYDPLAEVTTVTAGIPMGSEQGVFVIRGIDRDKTVKCLRTSKTETQTTATFDGEFITLENKSGAVNLLTFTDAKTAVMQGSQNPTKASLTQAMQIGAPLRRNAEFLAAEQKLAPGAVLAMVSRPGSRAFSQVMQAKTGVPSRYLYATVHLTDRVEGKFTLVLENAQDAAAVAESSRANFEDAKAYLDRVDVRAQGDTLQVDLAMTEAQIKTIVEMVKPLLGGL
jgi:hypothetical protein